MIDNQIPFSQTGYFSKFILDYLLEEKSIKPFYQYPISIEAIGQIIEDKKNELIDRTVLVKAITQQYQVLSNVSQNVKENIQSFQSTNTFCMVTAHQLNIFGGPLYLIYKIAQTIATCNQLKNKYPSYHFVPVYWMGSEDHDFEEINHIYLFNKKIEWTDKQGGATGNYSPKSIAIVIEELKVILGDSAHATSLLQIFENAYQQTTLSDASRYLMNALFGKHGLVVIDGNDGLLKRQFLSNMQDELENQSAFKLVAEQNKQLEFLGYKQQAFPREINLFYLSKNSRERIIYNASTDKYEVLNTNFTFSKEEILTELNNHPEHFSPNVILRPLYQQKTLPSLAYIGGGGELSYWLQLKTLFHYHQINFPQLILRNSALLMNTSIVQKIDKLNLTIIDFFNTIDTLKKHFITQNTKEDLDVSVYKQAIENTFVNLQQLTKEIDASLINTVGAEMQKALQSVDSLQKRLMKSLKQKNETSLNQMEKIKTQLFPENSLQERVENFSAYYIKYGDAFMDELIATFDVYHKQFLLIQLS
ncbi:MAG: hypothetical protein RJA25_293 [Bacteroidota bacterium]|jgi:bacillithiol biosynthesis cysteine-adding enzyme BshC